MPSTVIDTPSTFVRPALSSILAFCVTVMASPEPSRLANAERSISLPLPLAVKASDARDSPFA